MDHFEDCKTEEEFENYLKEIIEEQEAIEQIPKKCRYKIWTLTHWREVSRDGNTSVTIDLLSTRGQVCTYSVFTIWPLHFFHIIFLYLYSVGQYWKASLCIHFRILYWSTRRLFRVIPWRKHSWIHWIDRKHFSKVCSGDCGLITPELFETLRA